MTESPKTAYLIEDDEDLREARVKNLQEAGYKVTAFVTVDEALTHMGFQGPKSKVTQNIPDIIVTDLNTKSEFSGLELLEAAKDSGAALILNTGTFGMKIETVIAAGGKNAAILYKPTTREDLIDAVQKSLQQRGR